MRATDHLNVGILGRAIRAAREVLHPFGRLMLNSDEVPRLLQRWNVETVLEELPARYAGVLTPLMRGRFRELQIATHVPSLARKLIQLHEAGHLYTETATAGITYDLDDYHSHDEQLADAFAAVGLIPTSMVDAVVAGAVGLWEREDAVTEFLMETAEGLWDDERARFVAGRRLLVRDRLNL